MTSKRKGIATMNMLETEKMKTEKRAGERERERDVEAKAKQ